MNNGVGSILMLSNSNTVSSGNKVYVVNVLYCDLLCLSQLPVGKPHGQIIQTAYAADGRRVLLISPHPAKIAKTTHSTVQSESAVSLTDCIGAAACNGYKGNCALTTRHTEGNPGGLVHFSSVT